MSCRIILLLILLLVAGPAVAGIVIPPATITVGTNNMLCNYGNIQTAIDAANPGDTIRVQSQNWNLANAVTITNKSLTLVGGYSDCSDTTADPNLPTTISMVFSDSVLIVGSAIAGVQNVLIRNFVLRLGNGGANKGGGVDLSGAVTLRLDNVDVQENEAQYGGGIRIHGGPPHPTLSLEGGSRIGGTAPHVGHNNANLQGGGIYCIDGGVIQWRDAQINFNTALTGGGLFMNGCTLTMPTIAGSTLRMAEIRGNESLDSGGGMMMLAGSGATLTSYSNRQVVIADNEAGGNGGGVYLLASELTATGVHIEYNSSATTGGGVSMSSSTLIFQRGADDGSNCPTPPRCARLSFNSGGTVAGAIYASNSSKLTIQGVFMEANLGTIVGALSLTGNVEAVLRDVQMVGNQASNPANTRLFSVFDSILNMRNVSTTGNDLDIIFNLTSNALLQAHDNIIWEPGKVLVDGDGTQVLNLDCNNASDNVTFPGAVTHDPGFQSLPSRGLNFPLLRLAATSQNIDRCPEAPAPSTVDLGGSPRLVDAQVIVKGAGILDRGAFEYEPPLFKDGFED